MSAGRNLGRVAPVRAPGLSSAPLSSVLLELGLSLCFHTHLLHSKVTSAPPELLFSAHMNEFCSFWRYGDLTDVSSSAERGSPSSSHSSFTFLIAHGRSNQQLLPGNYIFDEPGLRAPANPAVLVGEPQLLLLAGGDLFLVPSVAHHPHPGFPCSVPGLHCQCLMKHHFTRSFCL